METELDEKNLRFTFGAAWQVLQYDKHADTKKHVGKVPHRKAVDFVGLCGGRLYLIEVKDFRGYGPENRGRLRSELAKEVGHKAFDTLAGLVLARRRAGADSMWAAALDAIKQPGGKQPIVALWMEDDEAWRPDPRGRTASSVVWTTLKHRCKPLDAKAVFGHMGECPLPHVSAADLPGAGQSA